MTPRMGYPHLGFGIGLRTVHFNQVLRDKPPIDWLEIISENFIDSHGWPRYVLDRVAERYPVVMHGVSLSIGSADPLDFEYLGRLKQLADRIQPVWVSDHLCWTGVAGRNTHDLLPIPLDDKTLEHVVDRIKIVQDVLQQPLVLENPSSYVTFSRNTMQEWEFLTAMSQQADCGLLLDVNNVYVSSVNHEFDPIEYIESIPADRIVQFHLAGHTDCGTHLIDTHDRHVIDPVWQLYRRAYQRTDGVSTLVEWDSKIPELSVLHQEAEKARVFATQSLPSINTGDPPRCRVHQGSDEFAAHSVGAHPVQPSLDATGWDLS